MCLGANNQISPAVVAGVGVDAVDCSTQVRVSTISSFSLPEVFFLGVVRQYSPCGLEAHITCPFPFSLLNLPYEKVRDARPTASCFLVKISSSGTA